jgi:hypothetical protein
VVPQSGQSLQDFLKWSYQKRGEILVRHLSSLLQIDPPKEIETANKSVMTSGDYVLKGVNKITSNGTRNMHGKLLVVATLNAILFVPTVRK